MAWRSQSGHSLISIHAPLTGSDHNHVAQAAAQKDFNPRSPYGERLLATSIAPGAVRFQSTLPLRGATAPAVPVARPTCNFNPRSPYGERLCFYTAGHVFRDISIHAPLTGSDFGFTLSILAFSQFQSTLPLRGATPRAFHFAYPIFDFNPRSPYGERPANKILDLTPIEFQSTLPLRGATLFSGGNINGNIFQSTLPLRGATASLDCGVNSQGISIHAPLTGSDLETWERFGSYIFQSTLPLRGATMWSGCARSWA